MVARRSGKIIFTASLLTFQGGITVPGYSASKGGIGQLTKAPANEWAPKGVSDAERGLMQRVAERAARM